MSDEQPNKKSLSEISHLFLSSIRDRQLPDGSPRPQRTPPSDATIDLTPEEFARVYGGAPNGSDDDADHTGYWVGAGIAVVLAAAGVIVDLRWRRERNDDPTDPPTVDPTDGASGGQK